MRVLRYTLLAVILTAFAGFKAQAKIVVAPKAYMYGFVANFTDSVVYFTDIQTLDSVWYEQKTEFVVRRSDYANQLRSYFADDLKMPNRTCIVVFGLTRKDIEKKYLKLKKKYTVKNAGKYDVKYLNENDFKFTPVTIDQTEEETQPEKPQKLKKAKKAKEAKKDKKTKGAK